MKKSITTFLGAFLLFAGIIQAQPKINSNQFPLELGKTIKMYSVSADMIPFSVNIGSPNVKSEITFDQAAYVGGEEEIDNVGQVPAEKAGLFPSECIIMTTNVDEGYTVVKKTDDGLYMYGAFGYDEESDTHFEWLYSTPIKVIKFPLEIGTNWEYDKNDTMPYAGQSNVLIIVQSHTVNTIDAWANITTPAGTFECLRMKSVETGTTKLVSGDIVMTEFPSESVDYSWIAPNYGVVATVSNAEDKNETELFDEVSFRLTPGSTSVQDIESSNVKIYPNPAASTAVIELNNTIAGNVKIELYNVSGEKIMTLTDTYMNQGAQIIKANISELAEGVYYCVINNAAGNLTRSLSVIR